MTRVPNQTGVRYGRYVVTKELTVGRGRRVLARCDCGTEKPVMLRSLRLGSTVSCGCYHQSRAKTHGESFSPLHLVWSGMLNRCRNPKSKDFKNYGGRGIKVCARWQGPSGFSHFKQDMGQRFNGLKIERRDNDGDYCPENCCWASARAQALNRRSTRAVSFAGVTLSIADWARVLGFKEVTLRARFNQLKWDAGRALVTPLAA